MTTTFPQGDLGTVLIDYRSKRRPVAIGAAVFMVLVVLVVVLKIVEGMFFQPENTVRAFFQALSDRDAVVADSLVIPDPKQNVTGVDLRGSTVLKSSGYTPPTAVDLGPVTAGKNNQATMNVSYSLGGQQQQVMLTLKRDEQAKAGLFHGWRIVKGVIHEAYAQVDVADSVLVAGTPAKVESSMLRGFGYPGGYQVTLPEDPLLQADPIVAYAGVDTDAQPGVLQPVVKPTANDEVDRQVRRYLDKCSKGTEIELTSCPSPWSYYSRLDGLKIKVLSYPTCEITFSQGQAVVRGAGQVRVRQKSFLGIDERTYDYTVSGSVTTMNGSVTFHYAAQ
jgi:hypothetical protein